MQSTFAASRCGAARPDCSKEVRDGFVSVCLRDLGWPYLAITRKLGAGAQPCFGGQRRNRPQDWRGEPWQHGRTERAGGEAKRVIEAVVLNTSVTIRDELVCLVGCVCGSRNRFANRRGYPAQHRVGVTRRRSGSLLSDDPIDRLLLSSSPSTEFRRASALHAAAPQALFRSAELARLRPFGSSAVSQACW